MTRGNSSSWRPFIAGLSPIEVSDAELVFGELLGNVFRCAVGRVDISLDESAAFPVLHVRDGGGGFEYDSRLPADPMRETGRGLFIVSNVADDLTVSQRASGGSHARAAIAGRIHRANGNE
jgi:anti-sigma regulatory factor (Ser/Thr protein kinase)